MSKLRLFCALSAGAFLLSDCSPKTGNSTASTPSTTKPTSQYPAAQVAEGQAIYTANCGKCHKLFAPTDFNVDKWNAVLPPMIKKARLTDEQGTLVRTYVMANLK